MHVSEAVAARKSVRAFLDKPVPEGLLKELLTKANRAPSGGNLQPWRVFVLNGESMPEFLQHLAQRTEREAHDRARSKGDIERRRQPRRGLRRGRDRGSGVRVDRNEHTT